MPNLTFLTIPALAVEECFGTELPAEAPEPVEMDWLIISVSDDMHSHLVLSHAAWTVGEP